MKKISIIGANSFLARNFIQYCKNNGLLYNFYLYDRKRIIDLKDSMVVDFNDLNSINSINYDVDVIIVFVGRTGVLSSINDYSNYISVNELLFLNLFTVYINKKSNAKIIYPSSRLMYKSNECSKISEESQIECKSVYAITKFASENYLKVFGNLYGLKYNILRICSTFSTLIENNGNYGTFEILENQAINKGEIVLFGDGNQKKTFTHLNDICLAFNKLIETKETLYSDYNLGGQELTMNEVAEYIAKKHNVGIKHIDWPKDYYAVDGGTVVFDSTRFDTEFNMEYQKIV